MQKQLEDRENGERSELVQMMSYALANQAAVAITQGEAPEMVYSRFYRAMEAMHAGCYSQRTLEDLRKSEENGAMRAFDLLSDLLADTHLKAFVQYANAKKYNDTPSDEPARVFAPGFKKAIMDTLSEELKNERIGADLGQAVRSGLGGYPAYVDAKTLAQRASMDKMLRKAHVYENFGRGPHLQ